MFELILLIAQVIVLALMIAAFAIDHWAPELRAWISQVFRRVRDGRHHAHT